MAVVKPYYNKDITLFAETNFRHQRKKFGIKKEDRKRHMYVVGKTGFGKSSMLEHMIVQDLKNAFLAFLYDGDNTILHLMPLFTDAKFRAALLAKIDDPVLRNFFEDEL